jgi:hypothetical protein
MRNTLQKSLFPHLKEKEVYYRNLIVKESLESSIETLSRKHPEMIKSFHDITFNNLAWGSSEKEIVRKLGDPRYKFQKVNDLDKHVILFFKIQICGHYAILQCHLFENELYFLHMHVARSLQRDVRFIEEMIHKKYSSEEFNPKANTCFEDYFQNKLVIEENVYLNIYYMSGKPAFLQKLQRELFLNRNSRQVKFEERQAIFFKFI